MSSLSILPIEDGAFRINWVIENFSYCLWPKGKFIDSPTYVATTLNKTQWLLRLYPNGDTEDGYISCDLHRMCTRNSAPHKIAIDFTVYIVGADDVPLTSMMYKRQEFFNRELVYSCIQDSTRLVTTSLLNSSADMSYLLSMPDYSSGFSKLARRDEVFDKKRLYFPNDTLTLRCDLFSAICRVPIVMGCTIRSRICVERVIFTWPIENFSSLQLNQKTSIDLTFAHEYASKFKVNLNLAGETIIDSCIQVALCKIDPDQRTPSECFLQNAVRCVDLAIGYKIRLLDLKGNFSHTLEGIKFVGNNQAGVWFTLSEFVKRRNLFADKNLYLPDDILSLHCEFSIADGKPVPLPKEFITSYPVLKKFEKLPSSEGTLMDDIKCLYQQRQHCDIAIKVGDKTFNAHKVILCSRSPVFSRMFECEMSEKNTNEVNIVDFDPETIEEMLRFMYTDNLKDNLDYSQAARLYAVAFKYQIQVLVEKCSNVLRLCMSVSNVWDILRLGFAFDDESLKITAKSFIRNCPEKVFDSQGWEDLMGRLPLPEVIAPVGDLPESLENGSPSATNSERMSENLDNCAKKRKNT